MINHKYRLIWCGVDSHNEIVTESAKILGEYDDNPFEPIREILESISCICAEGPEFNDKLTLCDAIQKEVQRGIKIMEGK